MKKTTKTLLSLLLALVMALQFGAVAPIAHADGISEEAKFTVRLYAPLSNGLLNAEGSMALVSGDLSDAGLGDFAPSTAEITLANIRENGLMITTPADWSVQGLAIAESVEESGDQIFDFLDSRESLLDIAHVLDDPWTIAVESANFDSATADIFNGQTGDCVLYVVLMPVTSVAKEDATCGADGHEAYYVCNGSYYINQCCLPKQIREEGLSSFTIAAAGEHTIQEVPAVEATAEADGNIQYWKCTVCDKFFSDAEGTTEITDKTSVITHYQTRSHTHTLQEVPAVEATASADGNIQYWKCTDPECDKYFSDANGENEITDKTSVITHYTAPAHTHTLQEVPAVEATASADGNIQYWKCTDPECDKYFSDANGENEITDKSSVITHYTAPSTTYDIIPEGTDTSWKKGSTSGASIHINADGVSVSAVKFDEQDLAADQYETRTGSVFVDIGKTFLEDQSVGPHTVLVTFSDGKTASSGLTILEADPTTPTALELEIAADGCKKVYDAVDFDLNSLFSHITVKNLPDGYSADVEISYEDTTLTSFRDAGSTTVKLSLKSVKKANQDVSDQFTCEDKTGVKLTIEKRKITVQTKDDSKVYDGKAWTSSHMSSNQPIVTYTDPALSSIERDGKTYNHYFTIKYTASPKSMGTYDNTAEVTVREKLKTDPNDTTNYTNVTKNYEITYKFGKIKITDANGNVPNSTSPATGDTSNIWLWVGLMAAAVVLVVVILVFLRKGRKNDGATE